MPIVGLAWLSAIRSGLGNQPHHNPKAETGKITFHADGLHGYIGFGHEKSPADGGYSAGMGFYAAVWPLVEQPWANLQIGLPSAWITPDNSDNKDKPLAPEGTLARTWKARGSTRLLLDGATPRRSNY